MDLTKFTGLHKLSGVDFMGSEKHIVEGTNVVHFRIDDKVYRAEENPDDGYRSFCQPIEECSDYSMVTFPDQLVVGRFPFTDNKELIEFVDYFTEKVVFQIGTDHSDSYYPFCIMRWNPENLYINQEKT